MQMFENKNKGQTFFESDTRYLQHLFETPADVRARMHEIIDEMEMLGSSKVETMLCKDVSKKMVRTQRNDADIQTRILEYWGHFSPYYVLVANGELQMLADMDTLIWTQIKLIDSAYKNETRFGLDILCKRTPRTIHEQLVFDLALRYFYIEKQGNSTNATLQMQFKSLRRCFVSIEHLFLCNLSAQTAVAENEFVNRKRRRKTMKVVLQECWSPSDNFNALVLQELTRLPALKELHTNPVYRLPFMVNLDPKYITVEMRAAEMRLIHEELSREASSSSNAMRPVLLSDGKDEEVVVESVHPPPAYEASADFERAFSEGLRITQEDEDTVVTQEEEENVDDDYEDVKEFPSSSYSTPPRQKSDSIKIPSAPARRRTELNLDINLDA
jgi:hypothetical protein